MKVPGNTNAFVACTVTSWRHLDLTDQEVKVLHELTGREIAGFDICVGVNLLLSTPLC